VELLLQECVFAYTLAMHDENVQLFYATVRHCMLMQRTHSAPPP
jgi:hypothetical protein